LASPCCAACAGRAVNIHASASFTRRAAATTLLLASACR
jgi:hypothetical protein